MIPFHLRILQAVRFPSGWTSVARQRSGIFGQGCQERSIRSDLLVSVRSVLSYRSSGAISVRLTGISRIGAVNEAGMLQDENADRIFAKNFRIVTWSFNYQPHPQSQVIRCEEGSKEDSCESKSSMPAHALSNVGPLF